MIKDLTKTLLLVLTLVIIIRSFFFQPFHIPSSSMRPTLIKGDHLFVSKYSYGYGNFSFPVNVRFLTNKLFSRLPARGDVVVFHFQEKDYIKRVLGLPGDRIQMQNSTLFINGIPIKRVKYNQDRSYNTLFNTRGFSGNSETVYIEYIEYIESDRAYMTLDAIPNSFGDNTKLFKVPAGHMFVLGDNRDNSSDSRFNAPIGFIPLQNLVGKAEMIYFSKVSPRERSWIPNIRWNRILKWIS